MPDYSKMRRSKNIEDRRGPVARAKDMRKMAAEISSTTSSVSMAPYPRAKLKEARQMNRTAMRLDALAKKKKK